MLFGFYITEGNSLFLNSAWGDAVAVCAWTGTPLPLAAVAAHSDLSNSQGASCYTHWLMIKSGASIQSR